MRHDHNCPCDVCFELNYGHVSNEDLEAAQRVYDAVVNGTHEKIQAEAVEWMRWFGKLNQSDKMLAATNQLTPELQRLRDTQPLSNRIQ